MRTEKYEIDVEFTIRSEAFIGSGFSIMLLKKEPDFPSEFRPYFGYIESFNGKGVFLHRSEKSGLWVRFMV